MKPIYDAGLRDAVRVRMSPPNRESVRAIARDTGIAIPTLSSWRSQWKKQGLLVPGTNRPPEQWSAADISPRDRCGGPRRSANGGRRGSRPDTSPRLLHHLQTLLALAAPANRATQPKTGPLGRAERRRRQHLALSQRLLDPLPEALRASGRGANRFWIALRWGGCGMVLAQLLK